MTEKEFRDLVGKDVIVDYPFCNELQKWSMKNFYIDDNNNIKHKRLQLILEMCSPFCPLCGADMRKRSERNEEDN